MSIGVSPGRETESHINVRKTIIVRLITYPSVILQPVYIPYQFKGSTRLLDAGMNG